MKDWTEELFMNLPEPEAGETPSPVYPYQGTREDAAGSIIDHLNAETRSRGKKAGKIDAPLRPPVYATPEEKQIAKMQEKAQATEDKAQAKAEARKPKPKHRERLNWTTEEERKEMYKQIRRDNVRKSQVTIGVFLSREKDAKIIEYIQKQPNKTEFFRRLVVEDMDRKNAARQLDKIRKQAPKKPI